MSQAGQADHRLARLAYSRGSSYDQPGEGDFGPRHAYANVHGRCGGGVARLFLSPLTSKTHVSRIMTKLDARDRAQLVVIAYESGLVTPGGRDQH